MDLRRSLSNEDRQIAFIWSEQDGHQEQKEKLLHYTPKHGSWLNMAEIEIGVISRQALGKPLPNLESFIQQVHAWTIKRNTECAKINWQFNTQDARIKLARLYPTHSLETA